MLARIVDDDGMLVLASAEGLRARYESRDFNYDFPVELVSAAGDEQLCAWSVVQEGEVSVRLFPETLQPEDARFVGVVKLRDGDQFLVLPYSSFTMACKYRQGEPERFDGSCAYFPGSAGRYACWIRHVQLVSSTRLYEIYLPRASESDRPLDHVPAVA